MSRSFRAWPSSERVEMKYSVRPSAVKKGSASTPSPAKTGGLGSDHPEAVQWLTKMRHPSNAGELRTKYSSPVVGSKAACDSNCGLEIPTGFQGRTSASRNDAAPAVKTAAAIHILELAMCARCAGR